MADAEPSVLAVLREEVRAVDSSRKALRSFGVLVGAVLLGVAAYAAWRRGWTLSTLAAALGGIGAALVVLGLAAPAVLRPVQRAWMALAVVLGFVMTRVILTVVFFGVVTPIGLVMRALGRDPMVRRPDPAAPSYWILRDGAASDRERLERYF